jgi:hypothetical protein
MLPDRSLYSKLLIGAGLPMLMLGALLAARNAFGSMDYIAGLTLNLLGLACCLKAIHAYPERQWQSRMLTGYADNGAPWETLREARFRVETQIIRAVLALILLVSVCSGLWWLQRGLYELAVLRRSGRICEAQIINKEPTSELGRATTGMVYYSFRVRGTPVIGRFRAPRAEFPLLRIGRRLNITYLPAAPRIHRLGIVDNQRVAQDGVADLLLLICSLAYVVGPIIAIERMLRRELHLARYGVIVSGTITGSRPIHRAGRQVGHNIRYQLTLPEIGQLSGCARIGNVNGEPTLVGFPITILVDPARPKHHRPPAAFRAVKFSRLPHHLMAV